MREVEPVELSFTWRVSIRTTLGFMALAGVVSRNFRIRSGAKVGLSVAHHRLIQLDMRPLILLWSDTTASVINPI